MTANQRASTTMLWIKHLTTSTFSSINQKVDKIGFFHRNKKFLMLLALGWCLLVLGGYLIFDLMGSQKQQFFLKERAYASEQLSNQCAPLLLEDDFLGLNSHVSEFAKSEGILFAAVLNHENSDIEAIRTIPEMIIPPVKSVRPDLPEELDRIVMRCLEKDKSRRYADATALHDDLMRLRIKYQISYDASDLSNFMRMNLNYA